MQAAGLRRDCWCRASVGALRRCALSVAAAACQPLDAQRGVVFLCFSLAPASAAALVGPGDPNVVCSFRRRHCCVTPWRRHSHVKRRLLTPCAHTAKIAATSDDNILESSRADAAPKMQLAQSPCAPAGSVPPTPRLAKPITHHRAASAQPALQSACLENKTLAHAPYSSSSSRQQPCRWQGLLACGLRGGGQHAHPPHHTKSAPDWPLAGWACYSSNFAVSCNTTQVQVQRDATHCLG